MEEPTQEEIEMYDNAELLEEEMSEDIQADQAEDDQDLQQELEDIQDGYAPTPEEQNTKLTFLKDILENPDRLKTAFLRDQELGLPTFPVRFWLTVANTICDLYGYDLIKAYCYQKAFVTSDTSLSRDGFIVQTAVTEKKVRERRSNVDFGKLGGKQ